ncbi:MAG: hypothetical protein RLZZ216_770 [Cyanobacteriota bacterium]|jgi:O-succinylbenzoic acid--CoA ligase
MTAPKRLIVDPTQLPVVLQEVEQALVDGQWIHLQAPKGASPELPPASACPQGAGVIMASGGSSGGRSLCLQPAGHLDQSATATGRWLTGLGLELDQMLVLNPLPVHHMSGLMPWWRSRLWGADHVVLAPALMRDPQALLSHCRAMPLWYSKPRVVSLVPTQLRRLLDHPAGVRWLQDLAVIWVGGAALPIDLADRARALEVRLAPCYGATETAAMVAAQSPERFLAGERGAGTALGDVELRLEASGALLVRTPRLAIGRWQDGALQPLVDANGWWRSGDGATLDWAADGQQLLTIHGRLDDAIQSGGETVFPDQLAQRLLKEAHACGCALDGILFLPVDHPEWERRLVALVRCREGCLATDQWHQLQSRLEGLTRDWLPAERPIRWLQCPGLAVTDAGKWERKRWQKWADLL